VDKAQFDHPLDIYIGEGRIVYAETHQAWALPGGRFTKDREVAEKAAQLISDLTEQYWRRRNG